jgi:predicted ester cyclase
MSKAVGYLGMVAVLLAGSVALAAAAGETAGYTPEMQAAIDSMMQDLQQLGDEKASAQRNLQTFDTFDFEVFSNQQWARLQESHSLDVTVHWPCGRQTQGLEAHTKDLMNLLVHAPDTGIRTHPVRVASGDYTAVTGVMTGTFSKPMPTQDGGVIEPTGKQFSVSLCTIGRWQDGVMVEKWLFYDSASYLRQMGVAQ